MAQQMDKKSPQRKKIDIGVWVLTTLLLALVVIAFYRLTRATPKDLAPDELIKYVKEAGDSDSAIQLKNVKARPDNSMQYVVTGTIIEKAEGKTKTYDFVSRIDEDRKAKINSLDEENTFVSIKEEAPKDNTWITVLLNLLPLVLMAAFFIWLMKANSNTKAMDFGKSTAHLARGKTVTFKDVAGCDEEKQEMEEIVDFLKSPAKYTQIGARIPKGVLLSGNPGTGKTLLARAVAGEAGVPFFSISGSEFVEMFVGVGASRVRDLFKQAKQNAPCIIFIDEIDAVGRQRGAGMGGGHDEREQTLNQLLVEMDGFATNIGIVVMAATNRPDVLDPALLRPGRFDRQITISLPDVKGREAILKVHARNKKFEKDINFEDIAHRLPGFSGAEIENLLNEAALLAARANRTTINKFDIDEATDRVMMGPAKKSHKMTDKERDRVAHHEAGHAVIGLKLENSNVVQKVTIIPRGQAGGYALMLPEEETYLSTKRDLLDRITGYLGGRVAEEICYNEVSTGASNDFQHATKIARAMVTEYGMSDLGPLTYEEPQGSVFLGRDYLKEKNFSDQVALEIDREQRRIIEECYADAKKCLLENKELLEKIAYYLKEIETLTKQDIDEIDATGALKWYDDKKKEKEALEQEKQNETKEDTVAIVSDNTSSNEITSNTTSDKEDTDENR